MIVRAWALGLVLGSAALAVPAAAQDSVRQLPPGKSAERARDPDAAAPRRDRDGDKNNLSSPTRGDDPTVNVLRGGSRFDSKFDEGMAAIRAKNPGKAIELMRPVLADFERRYAGEKRRVYCALTPEQAATYAANAMEAKRAAVTIAADWCRAQYVNAFALVDLERYAEATAAFERLVGFAPQNSRYLNEFGYALMKQKKFRESFDVYRRSETAADLTPDRAKEERCMALKGMGYDLVELGDLNGAEAAYRKCLAIDPTDKDSPGELEYIRKQRALTV